MYVACETTGLCDISHNLASFTCFYKFYLIISQVFSLESLSHVQFARSGSM